MSLKFHNNVFMFSEVIHAVGVNGQLETGDERKTKEEVEYNSSLAQYGWGRG